MLALLVVTRAAHADVELAPLYRHAIGIDYLGGQIAGTLDHDTYGLRFDLQLAFATAPAGQAVSSFSIGGGPYAVARPAPHARIMYLARLSLDSDSRAAGDEPKLDDSTSHLALGAGITFAFDITDTLWLGPSFGAEWRPIELGTHKFAGAGDAYSAALVVGFRP